MARLRGRLPGGPRVHPAARGGAARAHDRPLRRGPPEPGRGDGQRGRPARDAVVVPFAGRRGRRPGPPARPPAGPPRPRPATDAPERRAPLDGLLHHRLDPRPRGRLAAPARCRLRGRRSGALGLAIDRDPTRLRCRRAAPGPRRPGRPPPRARWPGGARGGRARRGRGRLSAHRGPARRAGRGDRRGGRVRPARGAGADASPDPGQRHPAVDAGWGGGPRDRRRVAGCSRRPSGSTGSASPRPTSPGP